MCVDPTLAILFLHALPLDGTMWRDQLNLFPAPTYAPTLYRNGPSIETWAQSALDEIRERNIIVIGCSIGGSCALEVAKLSPERVQSLVLVGTKAHKNSDHDFMGKALTLIETQGPNAAWEAYWQPLFSRSCDAEVLVAAKEVFSKRDKHELADGTMAFHTRPSRFDLLEHLPQKMVFVSGSEDVAPGPETTLKQAQLALRGSYHEIPNCGHYVPIEAPDAFNAILRQELKAHFC